MTDSTKNAMETLERLLDKNMVKAHGALEAAYLLGKFDGLMQTVRPEKEEGGIKTCA